MADDKKPKTIIHNALPGTAIYPYLNSPDTKWKPEGEFKVKVRYSDEDAAGIRENFEAGMVEAEKLAKAFAAKQLKEKKKKIAIKEADPSIVPEYDEQGEETGFTLVNFKSTASGVSKKTGKPWKRTIALFDANGNAMRKPVYSGSELIMAYSASPWCNPKGEYGVKFQIEGVQVVKLVSEGGAVRSASSLGFGKVDGGYADDGEDPETSDDEGTDDADGSETEDNDKF
jgi:hypothetical protein